MVLDQYFHLFYLYFRVFLYQTDPNLWAWPNGPKKLSPTYWALGAMLYFHNAEDGYTQYM
jgi:hypothetical protein